MSDVLPLTDAKARLSELVDRVHATHDRVTITRNGRPAAVMLSPDDLAALEETLEVLSDPVAMQQIAEARADLAAGRTFTAEVIVARYGRR